VFTVPEINTKNQFKSSIIYFETTAINPLHINVNKKNFNEKYFPKQKDLSEESIVLHICKNFSMFHFTEDC